MKRKGGPVTSDCYTTGYANCRYCPAKALMWVQVKNGAWQLVNPRTFKQHICKPFTKAAKARHDSRRKRPSDQG